MKQVKPAVQKEILFEDLREILSRAESLAHVLADAAAGGLGVENSEVNHVALMIAREIGTASDELSRVKLSTRKLSRNDKKALATLAAEIEKIEKQREAA